MGQELKDLYNCPQERAAVASERGKEEAFTPGRWNPHRKDKPL